MQHILERLRSEFQEMPGLRLTAVQIQRFCGVDPLICQTVLDALVESNFLCRRPDGTYSRVLDSFGRPAAAKAALQHDARARAS
jgi:hypothetical protein